MPKSLVIVESPAKAKTINKYLGSEFIVKSSVGHIRDLPQGGKNHKSIKSSVNKSAKMNAQEKAIYKKKHEHLRLVQRMGIDPEENWKAHYEILDGKQKVVANLKEIAKQVDDIYLATDLDREGEAIAWHLKAVIGGDEGRYKRVIFNEITKKAIKAAFEQPSTIDNNRVYAQQTRRFLDRIVGFMLSPLLWQKIARGLSAGRVQSVAVRILVERERQIKSFIAEEFWTLQADLKRKDGQVMTFEVVQDNDKRYRPTDKKTSDIAVNELKKQTYEVKHRDDKPTKSKPSAPFITSTLQQAASSQLGFSVRKTMTLSQRLYEAGYITYMRTDSTHLSNDSIQMLSAVYSSTFRFKLFARSTATLQ